MNSNEHCLELGEEIGSLEERISSLREKVEDLNNAAAKDMIGRVDELETMVGACKRDLGEVTADRGADEETVTRLYKTTEAMVTSLEDEVDALSLGNPTTVSAAVDAVMDLGGSN